MTPRIDGIDISHWNRVIDETAVPTFPVMSCKATEGTRFVDPAFAEFWHMFDTKGAPYRGAYHWIRSDSDPVAQADHFLATLAKVGGLQVGDIVQLDWETTQNIPPVTVTQIEAWCTHIRSKIGDRVIVYSASWVPGFIEWRTRNPLFPVWYANYRTDATKPGNGWAESDRWNATIWQWSSTTTVPGFEKGIDVNHVFDFPTLDRLSLRTAPVPIPPTPAPSPTAAAVHAAASQGANDMDYYWVGNSDNKADPTRYLWNGMILRRPTDEAEANLIMARFKVGNTLASPLWWPQAQINTFLLANH